MSVTISEITKKMTLIKQKYESTFEQDDDFKINRSKKMELDPAIVSITFLNKYSYS